MLSTGVHVSPYALAEPSGKPRTDDMREMVEKLSEMGQIRKVPAAFRIGKRIVMHPAIYLKLKANDGVKISPFRPEQFQGWTT